MSTYKIEIKIEITKRNYYYETKEHIKMCPECKKEYKTRKYCLNCYKKKREKIETIEIIKTHEGRISNDLKRYSCDCVFASFHGQSKYWKELRPKSICKHCKWTLRKINAQILPKL